MPKIPIFIRVDPELKGWLERQAEKDQRTLSDYVRLKLEELKRKHGKANK